MCRIVWLLGVFNTFLGIYLGIFNVDLTFEKNGMCIIVLLPCLSIINFNDDFPCLFCYYNSVKKTKK